MRGLAGEIATHLDGASAKHAMDGMMLGPRFARNDKITMNYEDRSEVLIY